MNGLVTAMLERTGQDGHEAIAALKKLHAVLEFKLGIKHRLEFK